MNDHSESIASISESETGQTQTTFVKKQTNAL